MGRLLDWASRRRSAVVTGVGVVVVATLVTTVAVASGGYEAQRVDLSDGTVWVANGERAAIGRANTDVLQLNSAVRGTGADLSVVQREQDVLLVDRSNATVGVVDTATAEVAESVPLPPESPDVSIAGDRVLVVSQGTGEVWSQPLSDLASFSNEVDPDLSLGKGLVTDVTPDGRVVAYSSDTGRVSIFDGTVSPDVAETHDVPASSSSGYQVASVGGHWAVLDAVTGALVVDGRQVDLSDRASGGLALQTGSDTGDEVLVATSTGLLSVSIDSSRVAEVVGGREGKPARPVVVGDCRFGAWAGGSAWSDCASARGGVLDLDQVTGGASLVFDVTRAGSCSTIRRRVGPGRSSVPASSSTTGRTSSKRTATKKSNRRTTTGNHPSWISTRNHRSPWTTRSAHDPVERAPCPCCSTTTTRTATRS